MTAALVLIAVAALTPLAAPGAASRTNAVSWPDVKTAYEQVHDYTCEYDKQERAIDNGDLQRIVLSFRKPLDVKLEWLNNRGKVDQIAVYRKGMNDGKLLARKTGGLASWVGTLKLDPTSGRALDDSRHPITEVGIGHIIEAVDREVASGSVSMKGAVDDAVNGRPAARFDLESDGAALGVQGAKRASVWVDRELQLPVKVEIRDGSGGLIERHVFTNIRLNPGLTDQTFTF